jgi:spore germination protein KA
MSFFITVSVPAIYLALVTYHQETIPTPLLLSISAARQGVPFPTIIEVGLMLIVFEILRETGVRMPYYIGEALSIVGALVLGTASVDARIVSAPIVIVVSITAITGLSIPGIKSAVIMLRLIFLLLAAFQPADAGITGK